MEEIGLHVAALSAEPLVPAAIVRLCTTPTLLKGKRPH